MMAVLKEKEWDKKLEEADCALEKFWESVEGVGESARVKISLLIKKAGEDGKTDP